MEKKTFLFYTSWKKNIDIMDDVELRRFINNLINYTEGNEIQLPTRIDQMVWNDVVELLNHNENKRQRIIEKRREAGKKGGAPVGNNNAQKKTNVEETNKNNQNNQMVEKQTKQPDICNMIYDEGYMKKEEGYMLYEEGNMEYDIKEVREMLNEIYVDIPDWQKEFWKLGIDKFIEKYNCFSPVEIDLLKVYLNN
jgi:hypothetical protein